MLFSVRTKNSLTLSFPEFCCIRMFEEISRASEMQLAVDVEAQKASISRHSPVPRPSRVQSGAEEARKLIA